MKACLLERFVFEEQQLADVLPPVINVIISTFLASSALKQRNYSSMNTTNCTRSRLNLVIVIVIINVEVRISIQIDHDINPYC